MLISVIIPCYNSEKTIAEVVSLVIEEIGKMKGYESEIILVNDFSSDNTFDVIRDLCDKYSSVKGIDLTRNFGQHNVLMTALHYTKGDIIVGMDDDLQTHPSQIPILVRKLNEGYDLVYGKYPKKKQSFFRNLGSKFNDFTVRKLLKKPKGLVASSFWAARKLVRDEVIKCKNYNVHLQGLFLRTTKRICNVDIEHRERKVGKSGYTLRKLLRLWASCINFSIVPLRLSMLVGFIFASLGIISSLIIVIRKLVFNNIYLGWSSIMAALFLFFGVVLMVLGLIGEYIGRIFLCINNQPQFVIREMINVEEE
ncbi:glycosyltransferase involved in cell wall biosynthesis [Aequitasia blattaphilus]|uniref:Glycosyltransferase family 2 protein n=1 Tax=Aequitasia blattaphilus TaxID=2949332 RepID=A0ABT1E5Y3_9FIRM|nr:glycosyltransferase family 2 protein [Aequitasia blattaphilus]MCP1101255.1 glycosyltransferase family 2 protein [Aequitasia blattaphilus]MCR8613895.1 glycosyltransferase family 2 protein [Aequitasia blattaphilus]